MATKRVSDKEELKHIVITRINDDKYEELRKLLKGNPHNDMAGLIRDVLYNRPIKVYTKDLTFDSVMEELSRLRSEIKAVGVNINQITRLFNSYPDIQRKMIQANAAFQEYQRLKPKIERLLEIISNLGKKWLSG